jgi:transcription elongation factor Elf1
MESALPAAKTCRHCRQTKPAGDFGRKPAHREGLQSWCTVCTNARSRELRRARGERPVRRRVSVHPGWFRCAACGKDLPESEFRRDGRGKPYSYCRECHNAYLAELNRSKRKAPEVRAKLRQYDRRRRAAQKRENAADREARLTRCRLVIERLRADGWSLKRISAETGIARSTLVYIRAGHVPFPTTYARLVAFERSVRP